MDDNIAFGYTAEEREAMNTDNVVIGYAIGHNAQAHGVHNIAIGTTAWVDEKQKRIEVLEKSNIELFERIGALEDCIQKQQQMIQDMWYAPGMPGYDEAKTKFNEDASQSDNNNK